MVSIKVYSCNYFPYLLYIMQYTLVERKGQRIHIAVLQSDGIKVIHVIQWYGHGEFFIHSSLIFVTQQQVSSIKLIYSR